MTSSPAQYRAARQSRDRRFDGVFFVGVLSTGIFCRPICPARMAKEDNVTYFDTAAEAIHAGYRPCKRCCPDAAPQRLRNGDEKVNQVIKMWQHDPTIDIATMAARIGLSTRQIHKLFQRDLGLSPSQYRLSEQLLFAKRLLQHANMSVLDVALACGFQTARALQQRFKQVFGYSPGQLKQQSDNGNLSVTTTLFLSYRPPYQWQPLVSFLSARAIPGIEHITEDSYHRNFVLDGTISSVKANHRPDKHGFDVEISVPKPVYIKPVLQQLGRVLDCDADWVSIEHGLSAAGLTLNDTMRGLRIPGIWDLFESGCRAILGQQVSVAAAINKTRQLVILANGNQEPGAFPLPAQVTQEVVEQLGMPATRKRTLAAFAEHMCDQQNLELIEQGDISRVIKIKGIGPWTCQYMLMRGTGNPDVWMEKDLAIIKQTEKYSLDAAAAAPWRSYLTLCLWQDYMQQQEKSK